MKLEKEFLQHSIISFLFKEKFFHVFQYETYQFLVYIFITETMDINQQFTNLNSSKFQRSSLVSF